MRSLTAGARSSKPLPPRPDTVAARRAADSLVSTCKQSPWLPQCAPQPAPISPPAPERLTGGGGGAQRCAACSAARPRRRAGCDTRRGSERGTARPEVLQELLKTTERVVQEIDSVEYGLTDIQEYYGANLALRASCMDVCARRGTVRSG